MARLKEEGCRKVRVLDLCCGKGGDLLKWQIGGISDILMTGMFLIRLTEYRESSKKAMSGENFPFRKTEYFLEYGKTG